MDHVNSETEQQFPAPEQDFEIYKAARDDGDYKHALYHLACALSTDPHNAVWLESLNDWIDGGEDLLPYVPVEENNYFAVMAVRAYICARMSKIDEAFGILRQVIDAKPNVPYLLWVGEWEPQIVSPNEIEADTIVSFASGVLKYVDLLEGNVRTQVLAALSSVLQKMCMAYPEAYMLFWLLSSIHRRQGKVEAALAAAETAYKLNKCWATAIGMALCFKAEGSIHKAADYYIEAGELDRENETGYLDLGDMYLEYGLHEQALEAYKMAADIRPNHEWAIPSILYCEYMINQDVEILDKIGYYCKANGSNDRARQLLEPLLRGPAIPFIDYIPEPEEASINVLRQVVEQNPSLESGGTIRLTINHLEAPSAFRAFELYLNQFGKSSNPPKLNLTIENVPDPDPREAIADSGVILWKYDEFNDAHPALPKPTGLVVDAVRQLAVTPYRIDEWYRSAGEIAGKLTPALLPDLFAVLTYPPEPPESVSSWVWVQRIQYAAVFIMAQLSPSKPSGSLLSLCYGQSDWPINAALTVLAYQAQGDLELEKTVSKLFYQMADRIPNEGYCFFTYALVCSWLRVASHNPELKEQLEQWKSDLEEQE